MKKITLLFFLFLYGAMGYGQHKVASRIDDLKKNNTVFVPFTPFVSQTSAVTESIKKTVDNATIATLDMAIVKKIVASSPDAIELAIPYSGTTVNVQLYKAEIFAQGFHADTDRQKSFAYNPGVYYRGIIKGNVNSLVSFNFFENEMSGIISSQSLNNLVVGHLPQERDKTAYVIYSDAELKTAHDFHCATSDIDTGHEIKNTTLDNDAPQTNHCVTVYFEIDYSTYLQFGASEMATSNWITSLFNNVQTLYDNDGITVSLKSFKIWTSNDPYVGTAPEDYLSLFYSAYFNTDFDGDVGQLIGMDPGSLGGLAPLEGVCDSDAARNVSYVDMTDTDYQTVPLYSWDVQSVTHELGHVMGSRHTHACVWNGNNTPIDGCGALAGFPEDNCPAGPVPQEGGTIMSYCHLLGVGVNFANGFGIQPAERIKSYINSANCLGTSCAAQSCHSHISSLNIDLITANSATFSWIDESVGPWQISYHEANAAPSAWQETTQPSIILDGLTPNTLYTFTIRTVCEDAFSSGKEIIFGTDGANICEGLVFTSPNGTTGFYDINQHVIRTFTSTDADAKIKVVFSSFGLEEGFDFLKVYDGPNTNSPLLGIFSGFTNPGPFISGTNGGALTFEFISDDQVNGQGWTANVSCESVLATETNHLSNFIYYPNPAGAIVTIAANESIDKVEIYNVSGQLLLSYPVHLTSYTANISSLASGIYIFKATSGLKEEYFKIIKQ